jgi:hypothetical protein
MMLSFAKICCCGCSDSGTFIPRKIPVNWHVYKIFNLFTCIPCLYLYALHDVFSTEASCSFMGPRWLIYPILSYPIHELYCGLFYQKLDSMACQCLFFRVQLESPTVRVRLPDFTTYTRMLPPTRTQRAPGKTD